MINFFLNFIFKYYRNIPASVPYNIIKLWLLKELNVTKIRGKLKILYNKENIDSRFIYKFIHTNRKIIANYLRIVYALEPLVYKYKMQYIVVDESFSHIKKVNKFRLSD